MCKPWWLRIDFWLHRQIYAECGLVERSEIWSGVRTVPDIFKVFAKAVLRDEA